jgi:hypothetical protein
MILVAPIMSCTDPGAFPDAARSQPVAEPGAPAPGSGAGEVPATGQAPSAPAPGAGQACNACHPSSDDGLIEWATMSGAHAGHLINPGIDCTACHSGTVANDPGVISNPALHMNGRPDVLLAAGNEQMTYDPASRTCTGLCHLFLHPRLPWELPLPQPALR